jgi:hypothetical protein
MTCVHRSDGTLSHSQVFFDMTGAPGEGSIDEIEVDIQAYQTIYFPPSTSTTPLMTRSWPPARQ